MTAEIVTLRGWATTHYVHVWPMNDRIDHELHPGCVCEPEQEINEAKKVIIYSHHALDGRKN